MFVRHTYETHIQIMKKGYGNVQGEKEFSDSGKYYVLKVGEDDRLVKQYVQTGRTIYGSAIEIKGGLNESDRIAFPYGKTAKEGIRAVESENM